MLTCLPQLHRCSLSQNKLPGPGLTGSCSPHGMSVGHQNEVLCQSTCVLKGPWWFCLSVCLFETVLFKLASNLWQPPVPSTNLLFWCGVGAKLQSLENARQVLSTVPKPAEDSRREIQMPRILQNKTKCIEYMCMWCSCLRGKTAGVLYHFPAPLLTQGLLLTLKLGWLTHLHPPSHKGYRYM